MHKLVIVILLISLIGLSCTREEDATVRSAPADSATASIMPLAVGNVWRFLELKPVRTTLDGYIYDTNVVLMSIISDTVIGDERWYRVQTVDSSDLAKVGAMSYRAIREDGLWSAFYEYDILRTNLFVKYPAESGVKWEMTYTNEWADLICDIMNVDQKLEVMGDTLGAVQVMYRLKADSQLVAIMSYAPDLGPVYSQMWNIAIGLPNGGQHSRPDRIRVLDSFHVEN